MSVIEYWNFMEKNLKRGTKINISRLKENKESLPLLELYILDKMSYLKSTEKLKYNLESYNEIPNLLNGKRLRDHLAHNNILNEILINDLTVTLLANAVSLHLHWNKYNEAKHTNSEEVRTDNRLINCDRVYNDLKVLNEQAEIFKAWSKCDVEYLQKVFTVDCIQDRDIRNRTPLHYAAMAPTPESTAFILFVTLSREINVQDMHLETPLHISARYNMFDTVAHLLDSGAVSDIRDQNGYQPIHYAAIMGNQITLDNILENSKLHVDHFKTSNGETALHIASFYGITTTVRHLIDKNANVNHLNNLGFSPLHKALLYGHLNIVKILADNIDELREGKIPFLILAVNTGNEEIVKYLLKKGMHKIPTDLSYTEGHTPLHYASYLGDLNLMRLLQQYQDVNATTLHKQTPLHFALMSHISGNSEEIVKELVEKGCSVNASTVDGRTPLMLSVEHSLSVSQFLLKHGANVNAQTNEGITAHHIAALHGDLDTTQLLLDSSGDINIVDSEGKTPLHYAVTNENNIKTVELLISKGLKIDDEDNVRNTALHYAVLHGCKRVVSILSDNTSNIDKANVEGSTPLHMAARKGFIDIVHILIDKGSAINAINSKGSAPLLEAVAGRHDKVVRLLWDHKADINKANKYSSLPLGLAVLNSDAVLVDFLLEKGSIVDTGSIASAFMNDHLGIINKLLAKISSSNLKIVDEKLLTLHLASRYGTPDSVKIISERTEINTSNDTGSTALHIAAVRGDPNIIKILLEKGAMIYKENNEELTPAEIAVSLGNIVAIDALIKYSKIDINTQFPKGTLLHRAASIGDKRIVELLIENGADINLNDSTGYKPIHKAAYEGHVDVVKLFISEGNTIDDEGPFGKTLIHIAAQEGQIEIIKLLIEHKLDVNVTNINLTPLDYAIINENKDAVVVLLQNGALLQNIKQSPSNDVIRSDIKQILLATDRLHKVVEQNDTEGIRKAIEDGAVIDSVVTSKRDTSLHLAVIKHYTNAVKILLENKCNLELKNYYGYTPLHLAVKSNQYDLVKVFLTKGAVYDEPSEDGHSLLDLTRCSDVKTLLEQISTIFKGVQNSDPLIIHQIKQFLSEKSDFLDILLNVKNKDNMTILEVLYNSNQSNADTLIEIKTLILNHILFSENCTNDDIRRQYGDLVSRGQFEKALNILKNLLRIAEDKSKSFIIAWEFKRMIASVLYESGNFEDGLFLYDEIIKEQEKMFGGSHSTVITTKITKSGDLYNKGKYNEALILLREIYKIQKSSNNKNLSIYVTLYLIGRTLTSLGKYEQAFPLAKKAYIKLKQVAGIENKAMLDVLVSYADTLNCLRQYDKALTVLQDAYEKCSEILGESSYASLNILSKIQTVNHNLGRYHIAQEGYEQVLKLIQIHSLPNDPLILTIVCNFAQNLFVQNHKFEAYKVLKHALNQNVPVFGNEHPSIVDLKDLMELVKHQDKYLENILNYLQEDLKRAIECEDEAAFNSLIGRGASLIIQDHQGQTALHWATIKGNTNFIQTIIMREPFGINLKDKSGRTALQYSVSLGHIQNTQLLLDSGADKCFKDGVLLKLASGSGSAGLMLMLLNYKKTNSVECDEENSNASNVFTNYNEEWESSID